MKDREVANLAKGAVGASAVSIALLLWGLLGKPPYSFYGVLKWVVSISATYAAYALWTASKKFVPISLLLFAVGVYVFFGKMRRAEWIPIDWLAVVLFGLAAAVLTCLAKSGKSDIRQRIKNIIESNKWRLLNFTGGDIKDNLASCGCFFVFVAFIVWIGVAIIHQKPSPEPTKAETLADNVTGDWESLTTNVSLSLGYDEHNNKKCTFTLRQKDDKAIESTGLWTTTDSTVNVTANGSAGSFNATYQLIVRDNEDIITPSPISTALLKDCFIRLPASEDDHQDYDPVGLE